MSFLFLLKEPVDWKQSIYTNMSMPLKTGRGGGSFYLLSLVYQVAAEGSRA